MQLQQRAAQLSRCRKMQRAVAKPAAAANGAQEGAGFVRQLQARAECTAVIERFNRITNNMESSTTLRSATVEVKIIPRASTLQIVADGAAHTFNISGGIRVLASMIMHGRLTVRIPDYRAQILLSDGDPIGMINLAVTLDPAFIPPVHSAPRPSPARPTQVAQPRRRPMSSRTPQKTGLSPMDKRTRPKGAQALNTGARGPVRTLDFGDSDDDENSDQLRVLGTARQSTPGRESLVLSDEQTQIVELCERGESVFFSGGAGTGKSVLLSHIVRRLEDRHGSEKIFVTATTGLAACNIGGITVHQFAGVGRGDGDTTDLIRQVQKRPDIVARWRQARVLIIDEISMMPPQLFESLNAIAKSIRGDVRSFGGIQLIVAGDFFQLPPVRRTPSRFIGNSENVPPSEDIPLSQSSATTDSDTMDGAKSAAMVFCFETAGWRECIKHTRLLHKIFRQTDRAFIDALNMIRQGSRVSAALAVLAPCVHRQLDTSDGILPTNIQTHKARVDAINADELAKLPGASCTYKSRDSGEEMFLRALQANCPAKTEITLKRGAQVMLVKTIDASEGLVNGARGVVTRFTDTSHMPVVRFANGVEIMVGFETWQILLGGRRVALRRQIPLDLSWAVSVHKSQGMTVDKAVLNLENSFEYGQVYVALSRVRSLQGLSLAAPIQARHIQAHPKVVQFYESMAPASRAPRVISVLEEEREHDL